MAGRFNGTGESYDDDSYGRDRGGLYRPGACRRFAAGGDTGGGDSGRKPGGIPASAKRLGLKKAYDHFQQVLDDPEVQVVHIATPNRLHFDMAKKALEAGKHVLCEKPLAMNSDESAELVRIARKAGLAAGVNYNLRYYPLNVEAADRVRKGEVGQVFSVCGSYVQDWLLYPTDYNWRVLAEEGGQLRAVADIGTHWLDLIHAITGLEAEEVCADLSTVHPVRQRPIGEVQTFKGKEEQNGNQTRAGEHQNGRLRMHYDPISGRDAGLPVGLAGDGRTQELPAV